MKEKILLHVLEENKKKGKKPPSDVASCKNVKMVAARYRNSDHGETAQDRS